MPISTRPAELTDLDPVVELTRQRRRNLARWEPRYWNPRAGADDLHPFFLRYCIEEPSIGVNLAIESGVIVGCAFAQPQTGQWFFDDLSVAAERWDDVGEALAGSFDVAPMITCCPRRDVDEARWLAGRGARRVSEYHSIDLRIPTPWRSRSPVRREGRRPAGAAAHTFMNGRVDPTAPGALVVHGDDGEFVASPPMSPPIFDPGGPTTVVESVEGSDRERVLGSAIETCRIRGDAQLIVVCAADDEELRELLDRAGASVPVDVWRL